MADDEAPGVARHSSDETPAVDASAADAPAPPARTGGDVARFFARGVGQTLITAGLVLLLFVVYEVWVTNIFAHQKQTQAREQLAQAWSSGKDPLKGQDKLQLPAGTQVVIPVGEGFANIYIPVLGKDFAFPVVEGTNEGDLEKGVGHYAGTAIPGQIGNFAVAGHRVGKGEPFLNLDHLKPGDAVVIQTASHWYVYKVLGKGADLAVKDTQGVPGREIVTPDQSQVIDPVPGHPGLSPTRALMTMTTCHPKYSATNRMIVHAALYRAIAKSGKRTPKEMGGDL